MNILQVQKYCLLTIVKWENHLNLEKAYRKQPKKQVVASKYLNLSNKIDELNQN